MKKQLHTRASRVSLASIVVLVTFVGTFGQVNNTTSEGLQAIGLTALQNPDAYYAKPTPLKLADETDFQVMLYPTRNPLLLKLLIGNRRGRQWTLRLETDRRELLHLETKRVDWDWQLLNLKDLPEGRYQLIISAGPYQVIHRFIISTTKLLELTDGRAIVF